MLSRTKRTLLPFEDEAPPLKRFHGLCTPPTSPEKKDICVKQVAAIENDDVIIEPRRLVFGECSLYSRTKSVLQRSSVVNVAAPWLPTRKEQYLAIEKFLKDTIASDHGNSLYITGPPGTGKTAQLELLMKKKFKDDIEGGTDGESRVLDQGLANTLHYEVAPGDYRKVSVITLNCIALRRPEAIWSKIHEQLSAAGCGDGGINTMGGLQEFLEKHRDTAFVVVLDEMDKLLTSRLDDTNARKIIVELFLLAKMPSVRFTLVGIANSMDIKDRFLNRLMLASDFLPHIVNFSPYTSEQMFEIVNSKLKMVDESECIIQPMAIKFAAKKCSSNTGDLRKLFDVLRNSIDIAELESIRSSSSQPVVRVTLTHVAKVFSTYMDNSSTKSRISKLNMQQKMVLCALVNRENYAADQGRCSIDDAYDYYSKLLSSTVAINPLKRKEFLESCDALEMCGVVSIEKGKHGKKAKQLVRLIKCTVDEKEFHDEVSKVELLKRLIV
ncbi:HGL286Wp [Eremothecium sinecaudum]|uniref:Cell division control protein n=1 Tax=Eremothecium sinecaudum TaxID=45286 RepID=A0A0X8HV41_9SACH|nr:HGL286Wp [Eremothecium sinecaudum]AMD22054.1 HGL286Wp [Eremothecium sinecaudum]